MKKKLLMTTAAAVLSLGVLAACGNAEEDPAANEPAETEASAEAPETDAEAPVEEEEAPADEAETPDVDADADADAEAEEGAEEEAADEAPEEEAAN